MMRGYKPAVTIDSVVVRDGGLTAPQLSAWRAVVRCAVESLAVRVAASNIQIRVRRAVMHVASNEP